MAWFQGDQIRILKITSKPLDFETGGITAVKNGARSHDPLAVEKVPDLMLVAEQRSGYKQARVFVMLL